MIVPERPFLSVVVPAYQGERVLPSCLEALGASDLHSRCWELVVVDDASSDGTAVVASRHADTVVRLSGRPRGPAYARNRGAEVARGDVLVFVDADVAVHADTLRRIAELMVRPDAPAAAFGSYDDRPAAPGLVSQYRNLLHHYVHQRNPGPAETFWAGCGAVRKEVFVQIGMFDELHYVRPQIEDIELGRRLRRLGHSIELDPAIQATHLKRWTLGDMVRTDFLSRGIPWMRLILREGRSAGSEALNVNPREKACTALLAVALLAAVSALVLDSSLSAAVAAAATAGVVLWNASFYAFLRRIRGLPFALSVIPLHLVYYFLNGCSAVAGWWLHRTRGGTAEVRRPVGSAGAGYWPPPAIAPAAGVWTAGSSGGTPRSAT